jgi:hypothetical protein
VCGGGGGVSMCCAFACACARVCVHVRGREMVWGVLVCLDACSDCDCAGELLHTNQ